MMSTATNDPEYWERRAAKARKTALKLLKLADKCETAAFHLRNGAIVNPRPPKAA